jgi:ectoine hydroxylase-related dioxygenase (phytanoyl-CoA dioxygenase family)
MIEENAAMTLLDSRLSLTSNGFTLASTPDRLGRLVPTDPNLPYAELREQYQAQGYLWLKGILDRDAVLDFRRRFFSAMAEAGLIAEGSDPVDGIYAGQGEDRQIVHKVLLESVRWAAYEAFCLAEPIVRFYENFLEGPTYLHKRKLLRHVLPGPYGATGAHYDLVYLRGGTDRICTSWIPIGDTPVEMGGLIYLEGSDPWARQMEQEFNQRNAHLSREERISAFKDSMYGGWLTKDLPSLADRINSRWLIADYEAGDMMVHSPYIIHAATTNESAEGRIRLSTDIRYQLIRDEIDVRWANHWSFDDML